MPGYGVVSLYKINSRNIDDDIISLNALVFFIFLFMREPRPAAVA